jgi:hypothetical protein
MRRLELIFLVSASGVGYSPSARQLAAAAGDEPASENVRATFYSPFLIVGELTRRQARPGRLINYPKVHETRRPRNHDYHIPRPRCCSNGSPGVLSAARPADTQWARWLVPDPSVGRATSRHALSLTETGYGPAGHQYLGSLQLCASENVAGSRSFPQIVLPARRGFCKKCWFRSLR